MRAVFITIGILFLVSCGKEGCRESSIAVSPQITKIQRLDKALFECKSTEEVKDFLESNESFSRLFLDADEYPNYEILAGKVFPLTKDPFIDTLYKESQEVFKDLSGLQATLDDAFGRMKSVYPEMVVPKVQTAVTGFYTDLYISDSLIIVGLDYFIGPKATYRPMDIPQYILRRYDQNHLPVTIVQFFSAPYLRKGKNESLLSEMIDFGKSYYFLSQLMPCTPDSLIIGFTPKEIQTANANEAVIWANFVENEVLYETSHITKRKFLGERPNVYEISQECPGRIGAWVGWKIVDSYMRNNNVDIKTMITDRDNETIFRLSGYKPKG